MNLWVHILNLPFGWMNEKRGARAAGLIGEVSKVDVDSDGKASGPFLHARVSIEIDKPIRRGVLLQVDRNAEPEWFDIQFEKLPFFCKSCGIMGHLRLECPTPAPHNEIGKLPYDVTLHAPEERRRKPQSFGAAAAESLGSSKGSERSSTSHQNLEKQHSSERRSTNADKEKVPEDSDEVNFPLKSQQETDRGKGVASR